jgi:ABC-type enterochelin transport system ATPase subunit
VWLAVKNSLKRVIVAKLHNINLSQNYSQNSILCKINKTKPKERKMKWTNKHVFNINLDVHMMT